MDSFYHRSWLTAVALTGVALGGCTSLTDEDSEEARDATRVTSQAVSGDQIVPGDSVPYGYLDDGYVNAEPGYPGDDVVGEGYVPGAPEYVIEGCDVYGNCFRRREWVSGGFGSVRHSESTSWSSQSGATCDEFGCVYY